MIIYQKKIFVKKKPEIQRISGQIFAFSSYFTNKKRGLVSPALYLSFLFFGLSSRRYKFAE